MKKALILASVASMIDQFNIPNIELLKGIGYEVHVAANFQYGSTTSQERVDNLKNKLILIGVRVYDIDINRNVFSLKNINAYNKVKALINREKYSLIHCHSPIGGVIARLASRIARKNGTKVIYTAHGFHFFKGAPLTNWMLFYPIERWLARYTDVLITINKEDYKRAQKFRANKVVYIPGVGIDIEKFNRKDINININDKRKQLGISNNEIVLLSIGELSKRKNHEAVIRALAKLENMNIIYLICGQGSLEEYLKEKVCELNVNVKFLGFRKDISEIFVISDFFIFPSYQEGLPVALMEAMASGLPVVCSNIRGNTDLIENGKGGYLVKPNDIDAYIECIQKLLQDAELRKKISFNNIKTIKTYDIANVNNYMAEIYKCLF